MVRFLRIVLSKRGIYRYTLLVPFLPDLENMNSTYILEACIASVADAVAAETGGADRLELNMALELDGLTPSIGLLRTIKDIVNLPIIVMIRPRGHNFLYTDDEFLTMRKDIDLFLNEGVAGFAFGILNADEHIDISRTKTLVQQMGTLEPVFHRAFDVTPNPKQSLEQLIDCGVQRILTSGQKSTALAGSSLLAQLVHAAQDRIEILPGGGINPQNVKTLINESGCTQIHGTFRNSSRSKSSHPNPSNDALSQLRASPPGGTDSKIVRKVRTVLHSI